MESAKMKIPKSSHDRYEDKQKRMDESHAKGRESYIKGGANDKKK